MVMRSLVAAEPGRLYAGERMLREADARVRTESVPEWWEGTLRLTTRRLIFLPHVPHPYEDAWAVETASIRTCEASGRNRLNVIATGGHAEFEIDGNALSPRTITGALSRSWIEQIVAAAGAAHHRTVNRTHRAAG